MRIRASLLDLGLCVSSAADLVSPLLADHHRRTAYLSACIGQAMGLDGPALGRAVLAASLHDIGALSLGERIRTLDFDTPDTQHAEPGFQLLREFEPFSAIAPVVRHHHVEWRGGAGDSERGEPVPIESHVVQLADRVAVCLRNGQELESRLVSVQGVVRQARVTRFHPDAADAFVALSVERVAHGLCSHAPAPDLFAEFELDVGTPIPVDVDSFSRMLAHVVDFRSHYTAAHSTGVAASADALARLMGMEVRDIATIRVAGHLHDLGKLAIPTELLEKPGRLSSAEKTVVRAHAALTGSVLGSVPELVQVADWASHHHERPDGSGYPDGLEGPCLALGARVVAASDVFTALSEERAYRPAFGRGRVRRSLRHMAHVRHLDGRVVEALCDDDSGVHEAREAAQARARDQRSRLVRA